MEEKQNYIKCERCGKTITEEEYESYDGLCEECCEIEIAELDLEEDDSWTAYRQKRSSINYHILSSKLHTETKKRKVLGC